GGVFFEDKSAYSQIQGLVKNLFILEHGEDDHAAGEFFLSQDAREFQAAHFGQIHIEHDDVGFCFLHKLKGTLAAVGFTSYFKTRVGEDHLSQTLPKKRVVVHNQHFDTVRTCHRARIGRMQKKATE